MVRKFCYSRRTVIGRLLSVAMITALARHSSHCLADDTEAKERPKSEPSVNNPSRVLASLGDELILQADVDLAFERTATGRNDLPPMPEPVLMAAVDLIARRCQALETLRKQKQAASDSAIDQWLMDNSPPELKLTPAQALAARAEAAKTSPVSYRNFLAFRLSWQAYLPRLINEKNLESHYTKQKSRFDGTRFKVEHLAIPVPPGKSKLRDAAHEQLRATKDEVTSGALSMADAAKRLAGGQPAAAVNAGSAEPLWITGSGPLMPAIVDYAIKTPKGQMSQTFDSATAVHMVRVLDVEPGERTLAEAQSDVRTHMLLYLLDYLAQQSADQLPLVWLAK